MENGLTRKYGLFTAICMVVGIVVGSGVFFKAQVVLEKTGGDLKTSILAWFIGGCVMLFCMWAFSILATKYEKVNGLVDYSEATVGSGFGYMVGWFVSTIYFPAMTSILAWVSARYTMVFITTAFPDVQLVVPADQGGCIIGPECIVLALVYLCGSYAINALAPILAGKFQVATTVIKMIPLLLMGIVGTAVGFLGEDAMLVQNLATAGDSSVESPLFAACVATVFAYEGWIIATSINSELKDSKKNLPIALIVGGAVIMFIYMFYSIGVAGGASTESLMKDGATVAFLNIFGTKFGNVLNIFIVISCLGTLNGLMLATVRCFYSLGVRSEGIRPDLFRQLDPRTNMPNNSAIAGLMFCAFWLLYFYGSNLAPHAWFGPIVFDSSELPIVTVYAFYFPIFINFMRKATDLGPVQRFVAPGLGLIGSAFMVFATIYSHGYQPLMASMAEGGFNCPLFSYLIVFVIIMIIGWQFRKGKERPVRQN